MFFGDKIRNAEILNALRSSHLNVLELKTPTVTRWQIGKSSLMMFPLHRLGYAPSYKNLLFLLQLNSSINSLERAIRRTKPDVVLAETSPLGWSATYVCQKLSIPCVVDCHGLVFAENKGMGYTDWRQTKSLEKEMFTKCDYLCVVSKKMKDYIESEFGISPNKIIVAPNGSNLQQFTAQYRYPLNVIYAGSLVYWEGVEDYVEISKRSNSKLRFYMAGAGSLKNHLLQKIAKEKIPVTYLGYIPRHKIFEIYSKMQIGVAPSSKDLTRIVASPIKVFDYMASGLPVVTPRIGDWGELITNEDCGIALDDDSIEKYIESLNILSSRDVWIRKSENAIKVIRDQYSWSKTLQPLVNLLSNIAQ
jgi:glycosyltransferase involved in cell wall biosynthesis